MCQRGRVDVYFDLSKAFDLVDHSLFAHKLESYNVSTSLCSPFLDYLSNRHNFVCVLGHHSRPYVSSSGEPQSSILGPIFFNVSINDLSSIVRSSVVLQYADDVKFLRQIISLEDCENLMGDVRRVCNWCCQNMLMLNPSKTVIMYLSRKVEKINFCYQIGNDPL